MMMRSLVVAAALLLVGLAGTVPARSQPPEGGAGEPPLPPARIVPGINGPDNFRRGCVDCHVNRPDMNLDVRISTLMKQWNVKVDDRLLATAHAAAGPGVELVGRHPVVDEALADIPAGCLNCHGRDSKVGLPFSRLLHAVHLSGGDQSHFMTLFQGECTHCHKLDPGSGGWRLASGPES